MGLVCINSTNIIKFC